MLLIGCPMCAPFCSFQHINQGKRSPEENRREHIRAMVHLRFCAELYLEQQYGGRYFLHEHHHGASSWQEDCIKDLLQLPGVFFEGADQCQHGCVASHGPQKGQPIRKPTGFMSNSQEVLHALGKRCHGVGGMCSRYSEARKVSPITCCEKSQVSVTPT